MFDTIKSLDEIQAMSRECFYNSIDSSMLAFIMSNWGQELIRTSPFLTTTEVENLFSLSKQKQITLRNNSVDPMPYRKEENCRNCAIIYVTEDLLKWLERHYPEELI